MLHAKNYRNWPMFHGAIEKIIVASFFMDQSTSKVILFFNSLLAGGNNKEYLTAVFKH